MKQFILYGIRLLVETVFLQQQVQELVTIMVLNHIKIYSTETLVVNTPILVTVALLCIRLLVEQKLESI
jgi:hypothetical protein